MIPESRQIIFLGSPIGAILEHLNLKAHRLGLTPCGSSECNTPDWEEVIY